MQIKTCARCGKLFNALSQKICPNCRKVEEEYFEKVKKYLREYPRAALARVSEDTGVSVLMIKRFIREGRIEISKDSPITLPCKKCGKPIRVGVYCNQCNNSMQNELKNVISGAQKQPVARKKDGEKMHYLRRDNINKS